MKSILVVVDMQNDFINGALGTEEAMSILPLVESKVRKFRGEVIFTRDTHSADYLSTREGKHLPVPHCIKGTKGHEIHELLTPYAKRIIDKPTFGSLELIEVLKREENEISSVTLVGLCTDICVISNAMLIKAAFPEIDVCVESELCAGVTPESHKNALTAMKMCQISII